MSKRMSSGPPVRMPKPRSRVGQLEARQPEVEQAAVDGVEAVVGRDGRELAEVRLAEDEAIAEPGPEAGVDPGDGRPIGVETEEAAIRVGRLQDPLGVPTAAEGRVDLEAAGSRREHRDDLLRQHRQVPFLHLSSTHRSADPERTLEAHVVRRSDAEAAEVLGEDVGVLELLAVAVPALGRPDLGVVARADDDGLALSRPAISAKALRDEDPTLPVEVGLEGAGEDQRWKRRAAGSVMGRLRTLVASASQPARVWIARHPSSQRDTTAPPSSCARKRAGTASRPFSSTVCRYSPVNTDPCHSLP